MFNLEKSIDTWCQSVHRYKFNQYERIEELKDHLYCKIEALQQTGMPEEQAFAEAIKEMGTVSELAAEHAKNRHFLSKLFDVSSDHPLLKLQERTSLMNEKKRASLLIGISIVFAIAMMVSSSLIEDGGTSQTVTYILLAIWWIPFSFLSAAAGKRRRCAKSGS